MCERQKQRQMGQQTEAAVFAAGADESLRPCVGIALFNARGLVWAGRRAHKSALLSNKEAALWQLPQGGIEPGEAPLAAARRELWEETGITSARLLAEAPRWLGYYLPDAVLQGGNGRRPFGGYYRGQRQKWFAFLYEGDESEIAINPPPKTDEIEFDAWAWRNLSDIAANIVEFKRGVYRQMAAEFLPVAARLKASSAASVG